MECVWWKCVMEVEVGEDEKKKRTWNNENDYMDAC